MSKKLFSHMGYEGSVDFSIEDGVLHGKILFIRDLVTYQADTIPALEQEFHAAVEDYLEDCRESGVDPNKPYSGTFNVRIGSERHKNLARRHAETGDSINQLMCKAVDAFLRHDGKPRKSTNIHLTLRADPPLLRKESQWSIVPEESLVPFQREGRH